MTAILHLPMAMSALVLASLVVCAGTSLQVATGVGLGLLAGPVLILTLQSEAAIFVAIILNLLVSLALLPQERGEILWPPLRLLLIGSLAGVPIGWFVLSQMDAATLKLLAGVLVLTAAAQLLLGGTSADRHGGHGPHRASTLFGGGVSGIMSGCLAIPGPAALWTLLRLSQPPAMVRATLRALFVFSYGMGFLVHFGFGDIGLEDWSVVLALLPAVAVGIGLGIIVKRRVKESHLQRALNLILLAMGLSLLWKGLADVFA